MKKCANCDKSFSPANGNQKYCTKSCSRKIKVNCTNCQKVVVRNKRVGVNDYFCSRSCSSLHSGSALKTKCESCEEEFSIKKSMLKYNYGKYCSNACHYESMKRNITCTCPNCGSLFDTRVNESDSRKYCSKECSYEVGMLDIPEEVLYNDYVIKRMTTRAIGEKFNTSKTTILRRLKKYGIERRTASESRHEEGFVKPSKEELYDLYWGQWKSYEELGELLKVDFTTIPLWLKDYGIEIREASRTRLGKGFKEPTKEELYELYITQELTTTEVGKILGCTGSLVSNRLHGFGIEVRPNIFDGSSYRKCVNGLLVRSNYERYFANLLIKNGIDFEYEARLPFDKRYASDFLVDDVYVEIWGVVNNEKYTERRIKKTKLYSKHGLRLLEIYPEDFTNLYDKISKLKRLIS